MMNSQLSQKESESTEKPAFLEPLKSVFFQYFEQLVDSCCVRIDTEFGLQLAKGHEHVARDKYKNLVESLRLVREDIKQNYLLEINDNFNLLIEKKSNRNTDIVNLSQVLLASDDFVKEDYTTNQIIRHNQQKYHEIVGRLNLQLAPFVGKSAIAPAQNPVSPENLVKSLIKVVKNLKLGSIQRIALYKTFDDNVFNQMGFIYHELIIHCESWRTPVESSEKPGLGCESAQLITHTSIYNEFEQLQRQLSIWRNRQSPSEYDLIRSGNQNHYEHFEMINALHIIKPLNYLEPCVGNKPLRPLKRILLKKLEELNFSGEQKATAKTDEDTLDLISIIFTEISRNDNLSDAIKLILLELAIPMSAACLGEYGVFTTPDHPIKRLLDDLVAFGYFVNHDTEKGRISQKHIANVVARLNQEKGFTVDGWAETWNQWHQFAQKHCLESQSAETAVVNNMIEQERRFEVEQAAISVIESSLHHLELPEIIRDFLNTVWKDAMIYAYTSKENQPELWLKSVNTLNALIDSLTPPSNPIQRKQRLKLMPEMIKQLRNGLNAISCDKEWQSRFFKELAVLHVLTMNQSSTSNPEARKTIKANCQYRSIDQSDDEHNSQINCLSLGDWLVFDLDQKKKWAKLVYRSNKRNLMLFVDKQGEFFDQIACTDLAEQLRLGRTAKVQSDEMPVTDAILLKLRTLNSLSNP